MLFLLLMCTKCTSHNTLLRHCFCSHANLPDQLHSNELLPQTNSIHLTHTCTHDNLLSWLGKCTSIKINVVLWEKISPLINFEYTLVNMLIKMSLIDRSAILILLLLCFNYSLSWYLINVSVLNTMEPVETESPWHQLLRPG